ncbi:hypothetical protein L6R53_21265 [Myxococcota bacterium]|nr:hypothetical protein [Myxococcota bacterium]
MKTLLSTFAALGLLTGVAVADDSQPPTTQVTETTETAPTPPADEDCTKLEGEAKTECEAKKAAAAEAPTEEKKGKSMEKSNDNRMESYVSDE